MKKIFFDKGSSMHRILAILEQVASFGENQERTSWNR